MNYCVCISLKRVNYGQCYSVKPEHSTSVCEVADSLLPLMSTSSPCHSLNEGIFITKAPTHSHSPSIHLLHPSSDPPGKYLSFIPTPLIFPYPFQVVDSNTLKAFTLLSFFPISFTHSPLHSPSSPSPIPCHDLSFAPTPLPTYPY